MPQLRNAGPDSWQHGFCAGRRERESVCVKKWAKPRKYLAGDTWLGNLDSNQDKQSQSLLCYRYTIPQCVAGTGRRASQIGGQIAIAGWI